MPEIALGFVEASALEPSGDVIAIVLDGALNDAALAAAFAVRIKN